MSMDFKGKIGPLPAWAWGLFIGAVFVVWMWASRRDAQEVAAPPATRPVPVSGNFDTVTMVPAPDVNTVATADPTNREWLVQAVNAVANNSGTSRLAAQATLEKYLYGDTSLTPAEQATINLALNKVGLPPQGTSSSPILQTTRTAAEIQAERDAAARAATAARTAANRAAANRTAAAAAAAARNKRRPLSVTDRIVRLNDNNPFFRIEYDGSVTPITPQTWSAYRLTRGSRGAATVDAATWQNVQRARRNPVL